MNIFAQKNFLALLLFTLGMIIMGCEPDVYFEEALPPDVESIQSIPDKFLGVYQCESDKTIVHVERDMIYTLSYEDQLANIQEIPQNENCEVQIKQIYLKETDECASFKYVDDDNIEITTVSVDTLFAFRHDEEILKLYDEKLFFNLRSWANYNWVTYMVTPQSNGFQLWERIEIPSEKNYLSSLDNSYREIIDENMEKKYVINPSAEEFDEALEQAHLLFCDLLIPIDYQDLE